jgi:hypothetical protein
MKKKFIILNILLLTACTNYGHKKVDNFKTNNSSYNDPDILFIQTDNPFLDDKVVAPKSSYINGYKKEKGNLNKNKTKSKK